MDNKDNTTNGNDTEIKQILNLKLNNPPDFIELADKAANLINDSSKANKFTFSYLKTLIEQVSPCLESEQLDTLTKLITSGINNRKRDDIEKKKKGDNDTQATTITKKNQISEDDFC